MKIKACLTSNSDQRETPKDIMKLMEELQYRDICPLNENYKTDALQIDWYEKTYCNPPYSNISKFIEKAITEAKKGKYIILLIPARTDTKWFEKLIYSHMCTLMFVTGRLKFSNKGCSPFPSVFAILNPDYKRYGVHCTWANKENIALALSLYAKEV